MSLGMMSLGLVYKKNQSMETRTTIHIHSLSIFTHNKFYMGSVPLQPSNRDLYSSVENELCLLTIGPGPNTDANQPTLPLAWVSAVVEDKRFPPPSKVAFPQADAPGKRWWRSCSSSPDWRREVESYSTWIQSDVAPPTPFRAHCNTATGDTTS